MLNYLNVLVNGGYVAHFNTRIKPEERICNLYN